MVKALHRAGIEVILDVVYNHTAESDHRGPTLAFRGIDNAAYYRLDGDRRRYVDFTGTGNTLDTTHPSVLRLVMDSLRYWVTECHVDGFRFDLASTLARDPHDFNRRSSFLAAIHQDPVLSQVKLIAEPWDLGSGGYQVGGFPPGWSEWNDAYRDTMRDFWRAQTNAAAFAGRFTGSRDLFRDAGRAPWASTNFITAHDGFTLADLVSYNSKHNEANLEDNHDGRDDNRSWNCGAEGPTDDPEVNALRGAAAAQLPGDPAALAGHADAARRRRARPHAGRQQQRLVPGQRDVVVRLGARRRGAPRVHTEGARAAAPPSRLPVAAIPERGQPRRDAAGCLVVPPRRPGDGAARLAVPRHARARRLPEQRRGRLGRLPAQPDAEPGHLQDAAAALRATSGRSSFRPRCRTRRESSTAGGRPSRSRPARCCSSAASVSWRSKDRPDVWVGRTS